MTSSMVLGIGRSCETQLVMLVEDLTWRASRKKNYLEITQLWYQRQCVELDPHLPWREERSVGPSGFRCPSGLCPGAQSVPYLYK